MESLCTQEGGRSHGAKLGAVGTREDGGSAQVSLLGGIIRSTLISFLVCFFLQEHQTLKGSHTFMKMFFFNLYHYSFAGSSE